VHWQFEVVSLWMGGVCCQLAESTLGAQTGLMDWWKSQYRSLLGRHGDIASNNRRVESVWQGVLALRVAAFVGLIFYKFPG
jgi:hypothetical protein